MTPIPDHLTAYPWYAPHLAWLRAQGHVPAHDPGDAAPVRAILRGADLTGANLIGAGLRCVDLSSANLASADLRCVDLRDANLASADLHGANLRGANLPGADLRFADIHGANLPAAHFDGADLRSADIRFADLRDANLTDVDLRFAKFTGADLSGANLRFADLTGAVGISSAGPVGRERRIIYAVRHGDGDGVMIQAGCWWGGLPDTEARIAEHYAGDPWLEPYLAAVRAAAACVLIG